MRTHWFTITVVSMWLSTMSWLVVTKLVPPFLTGDPPTNSTVYSQQQIYIPIGWDLKWGGKDLGWAVTAHNTDKNGYTNVLSHVHFDFVPLDEMLPMVLSGFWNSMMQSDQKEFSMDAESELKIDPHGQLYQLSLNISTPSIPLPIRVSGHVVDKKLRLRIRMGEYHETMQYDYAGDTVLGNDLMPQTRMPNLYLGQEWTMPVYSPFRTKSGSSIEMYQAKVEKRELVNWQDQETNVWQVILRRESGALFGNSRSARTKLWVDMSGDVLKQECFMFGSKLSFMRTREGKSQDYWAKNQEFRKQRWRNEREPENNLVVENDEPIDLSMLQGILAANDFSLQDVAKLVPLKNLLIRTMKYNAEEKHSTLKPDIWTELEKTVNVVGSTTSAKQQIPANSKGRPGIPNSEIKAEDSPPVLK